MGDKDLEFWDYDKWKAFIEDWSDDLKKYVGSRLRTVQQGDHPKTGVKPLTGFKGISLFEIKHRSGARVVYTTDYVSLADCVHEIGRAHV